MNSTDDDDWLAALAGRPREGMAPGTRAEALCLREALREQQTSAPIPVSAADTERLLAAARAQGLLAGSCRSCEALRAFWQGLRSPRRLSLTAGLGFAVLMLLVQMPRVDKDQAEEPALRGEAVQVLRDADPAARRERVAALLTQEGVAVRRYERLGRLGLDAQIPPPARARLSDQLARAHGLRIDADGGLRLEVEVP